MSRTASATKVPPVVQGRRCRARRRSQLPSPTILSPSPPRHLPTPLRLTPRPIHASSKGPTSAVPATRPLSPQHANVVKMVTHPVDRSLQPSTLEPTTQPTSPQLPHSTPFHPESTHHVTPSIFISDLYTPLLLLYLLYIHV